MVSSHGEKYHGRLKTKPWLPEIGLSRERHDVHAVYLPELEIDLDAEAARLSKIMDEHGNVIVFLSEGAGVDAIVAAKEAAGEEIVRDAFGHVQLDFIIGPILPQFADKIKAEKVLVQKVDTSPGGCG